MKKGPKYVGDKQPEQDGKWMMVKPKQLCASFPWGPNETTVRHSFLPPAFSHLFSSLPPFLSLPPSSPSFLVFVCTIKHSTTTVDIPDITIGQDGHPW